MILGNTRSITEEVPGFIIASIYLKFLTHHEPVRYPEASVNTTGPQKRQAWYKLTRQRQNALV